MPKPFLDGFCLTLPNRDRLNRGATGGLQNFLSFLRISIFVCR